MMRRRPRGAALPAAIALVAVAGAVSAAVATLARTEILLARSRDAAIHALAAADGCLAAVIAELPAGWEFDGLVAGADGIEGTADDGVHGAPPDCVARFSRAPGPAAPVRALLDVQVTAAGGQRRVQAVVARDPGPGVPALLWLGDTPPPAEVEGTLDLDGIDRGRPGEPARSTIAAPANSALLDAWLPTGAGHVTIAPGTPAALTAPAPPLAELAVRARDAGAAPGGTLVPAGPPPLALTLISGDLVAASSLRGRGLLVVDGRLDISGSFEFNGVVVATRGIRVAAGARLGVAGTIWLGAGAPFVVEGEARVSASLDAVEAADALLRLPRRALLAGLRDPP